MGMGGHDDQRDTWALGPQQPVLYHALQSGRQVSIPRTGIPEQRALFAEEQIEERFFVVGASGLAEDVKIPVVLVDLPFGIFHAFRPARHPLFWQDTGANVASVRLRQLRPRSLPRWRS